MIPTEKPSSWTIFKRRFKRYCKHPGDILPDYKDYINRVFYGTTGKLNIIGGLKYLILKPYYLYFKELKYRINKRKERREKSQKRWNKILPGIGKRFIIIEVIFFIIALIIFIIYEFLN